MRMSFTDLTVDDIRKFPVWRFTNESDDEFEIEVVSDRPCTDLSGIVVGIQVQLADGTPVWAMLQNISRVGPAMNDHFLTITIDQNGHWFPLARYHDVLFEQYCPARLAKFLDKTVEQIFPIRYDLREILGDDIPELVGTIDQTPQVRLSLDELLSLAAE